MLEKNNLSNEEVLIENPKSEKENEFLLRETLEKALTKGIKLNEGNDGIILELDINDFSPEARSHFFPGEKDNSDNTLIAKTLKIFTPGSISREFESNKNAYDLVESESAKPENKGKFAKIVRPYFSKELDIEDESIKKKLKSLGVKNQEKVSILIEDYIAGENFSLHVFKKMMDEIPFLAGLKKEVLEWQKEKNLDQEEENTVHKQILLSLGIKKNILADEYQESLRIAGRLKEFMKDNDVRVDQRIINKVVNTMNLLNQNGIYHNDLHERNIMIELDKDGNMSDVVIIDFGKASENENISTDNNVIKGYEEFGK
jgi:hypothetical protein